MKQFFQKRAGSLKTFKQHYGVFDYFVATQAVTDCVKHWLLLTMDSLRIVHNK